MPFQIGFQEMKDDKSRDFMSQYMVPNSKENGINGIYHVIIKGEFTNNDFDTIVSVFGEKSNKEKNSIKVELNENQIIEFQKNQTYEIELFTNADNENTVKIENLTIHC